MSSYRFYFARSGALSLLAFQAFFDRQAHFHVDGATAAYRCRDTHASFTFGWIHPTLAGEHVAVDGADVSVWIDVPVLRAPFVIDEANREIAELVAHFDLRVIDAAHDDGVAHRHDPKQVAARWREANLAAIRERLAAPGAPPLTLPAATIASIHRWNQQRVALAEALDATVHVPRIEVSAYQRRLVRWVGWSDTEPIALPEVDYVVVSHEPRGLRKLVDHEIEPELATWDEVQPLLTEMTRDAGPPPFHVVRQRARFGSAVHRWLHVERPHAEPVIKGRRDLATLLATEDVDAAR